MNKLSIIIIAKNEGENIKECLKSVKWADEIVVVDDMSTDRTVEICRQYPNVKVYEKKMEGFGPQKNYALSKATGEWILSLDADERVPQLLREEILTKITQGKHDGYCIRRNNLVFGKWMLDYKAVNLRLFRKEKGKFSSKKVDEKVMLEGDTGILQNPLLHAPFSHSSVTNYIKIVVGQRSSYTADDLYNMGRRVTIKNCLDYFFLRPIFIFFQKFFSKKGYRQEFRGFLLSVLAAIAYFVSYIKLLKKQNQNKGK